MKSIPLSREAKKAGILRGIGGRTANEARGMMKLAVEEIKLEEAGRKLLGLFRDNQGARGADGCRCPRCVIDMVSALRELLNTEGLQMVKAPRPRK